MRLNSMALRSFRSYTDCETEFSGGINVIVGKNGQGKTNLLEAIYLIATGRGFKARSDKELIAFSSQDAHVSARGVSGDRERRVELTLRRGQRRDMSVNGVKCRTAAELAGNFSAVLFCPEDLNMIRGGASERRRLMDMCISQLRPRYAAALASFSRAYEGKTRLLRDCGENPGLLPLLEEYDLETAKYGAILIHYRANFVERLAPEAGRIHGEFGSGERLELKYKTVDTVTDPKAPPSAILPELLEHQRTHKDAELASHMCLSGAHKDDLEIDINGCAARAFASQGQTRTAALSIKLAELNIHRDTLGEYPLLLLDDVLSELDEGRQDFVLNRIGGGQVFITCCEDERVSDRTGGRVLTVDGGRIYG